MDTKLYVVRHGQSDGNLKGEFHGHYPSNLTEFGIKQVECTARFLKDCKIDVAFASDIPRAYNTGKIIAESHGLCVTKDESLREINGGIWEQVKFDDIEVQYPKEYAVWRNDLGNCTCPGGESIRHLAERVRAGVEKIVKENAGKNILIASHALPIRCMTCFWKGLDIAEIGNVSWSPNAAVTVVNYDSQTLEFEVENFALYDHLLKEGLVTELPKNI